MNDHPLKPFQDAIDIKSLRIINFPSLIFFCGGERQDGKVSFYSMRHYLWHYLKRNNPVIFKKLILAEKINDWFRGGYYRDLLTFEKDIAGLAQKIIIFVESPGSIAELASFSQIEEIRKKLIVFISERHYEKQSFIRNGPISYLLDKADEAVYVHPWATEMHTDGKHYLVMNNMEECASDIAKEIADSLEKETKERVFHLTDSGHVLLFTADIVDVMYAPKKNEIGKMLAIFDINDIEKYLFILQKLEIIRQIRRGNDDYYIRNDDTRPFIKYSYQANAYAKDRLAWKMLFTKWYAENDSRRISATRPYMKT
jgi:hypothetical protein